MDACPTCGSQIDGLQCPTCGSSELAPPTEGVQTADHGFFEEVQPTGPVVEAPRSSSKGWLYAIAAFAVVLLGVGFLLRSTLGLFIAADNTTHEYVPVDADIYVVVDVFDTAAAATDDRFAELFDTIEAEFDVDIDEELDLEEGVGFEEEILDGLAEELGVESLDLSFGSDVASWAGRHVALWVDIVDLDAEEVNACFVVEARDTGDADAALERIYTELSASAEFDLTRDEVDGRVVYRTEADGVAIEASRLDDAVVLCVADGLEAMVDARTSGQTLELKPSYSVLVDQVRHDTVVAYFDGSALWADAGEELGFDFGSIPLESAIGVELTEAGVSFDSVTLAQDGDYGFVRPAAGVADELPAGAYFASGGQDLGSVIISALDLYRQDQDIADLIEDGFAGFKDETGVDAEEMIAGMTGPFGFALTDHPTGEVPVSGVLFTGIADRSPYDNLLEAMTEAGLELSHRTVGAFDVTSIDVDLMAAGLALSEDRMAIGVSDTAVDAFAAGPALSSDPAFQQAVGLLSDETEWVGFFNIDKTIDAIIATALDDVTDSDEQDVVAAMRIVSDFFPVAVAGTELGETYTRQVFTIQFVSPSGPDV